MDYQAICNYVNSIITSAQQLITELKAAKVGDEKRAIKDQLDQLKYDLEVLQGQEGTSVTFQQQLMATVSLIGQLQHYINYKPPPPKRVATVTPTTSNGQTSKENCGATLQTSKSAVKFKDVAGFDDVKNKLDEAINDPIRYPNLFVGNRQPIRTVLLYGPPGTGKTLLAKAVAGEVGAIFYNITSADLVSHWQGDSEKAIRSLFDTALNQKQPVVIFIDEIDSICRMRNATESDGNRRIKTELMTQMQRIEDHCKKFQPNGQRVAYICFIGATNCVHEMDPAFLRRFELQVHIGLPDETARICMLKMYTDQDVCLSEADWSVIGKKTVGLSGSDLKLIAREALQVSFRELKKAVHWTKNSDGTFSPDLSVPAHKKMKLDPDPPSPSQQKPRPISKLDLLEVIRVKMEEKLKREKRGQIGRNEE